jgi:hypothetical protein
MICRLRTGAKRRRNDPITDVTVKWAGSCPIESDERCNDLQNRHSPVGVPRG